MSHPAEVNQSQEIRPLSLSWALLWALTLHGILGEELVRNRQKAVSVCLFSKLTAHWIPGELQNMLMSMSHLLRSWLWVWPGNWEVEKLFRWSYGASKAGTHGPKGPVFVRSSCLWVETRSLRRGVPSILQVGTWVRRERHLPWAVSKGVVVETLKNLVIKTNF